MVKLMVKGTREESGTVERIGFAVEVPVKNREEVTGVLRVEAEIFVYVKPLMYRLSFSKVKDPSLVTPWVLWLSSQYIFSLSSCRPKGSEWRVQTASTPVAVPSFSGLRVISLQPE